MGQEGRIEMVEGWGHYHRETTGRGCNEGAKEADYLIIVCQPHITPRSRDGEDLVEVFDTFLRARHFI